MTRLALTLLAGLALAWVSPGIGRAGQTVVVLAPSDALDPGLLDAFSRATGMPVAVDPYTTPSGIEPALRTTKTGYDLLLAPAAAISGLASRLRPLGAVSEAAAVEPALAAATAGAADLAVAFDWYPTGLVLDAARLAESGIDAASAATLLIRPDLLRKAAACGVGVPDRPQELFGLLAAAIGPEGDRRRALSLLTQLRLLARKGSDGEIADDVAQGDLCVAILPAPLAAMAIAAANLADDRVALTFMVPDRGTMEIDALALPTSGHNPAGARALLRYLLAPDRAAANARYGHVASALRGGATPADLAFDSAALPRLVPPPAIDAALGRAVEAEWRRGAAR